MKCLSLKHDLTEWRLFIDSTELSLKAVLLYNGNHPPFILVGHAVSMSETYLNLTALLDSIRNLEFGNILNVRNLWQSKRRHGTLRGAIGLLLLFLYAGQWR